MPHNSALTPTNTTSRSDPKTEEAPIIVLQEAPICMGTGPLQDKNNCRQAGSSGHLNTRHDAGLNHHALGQQENPDPDLSLNPQQLEDIVIHSAPVPDFINAADSPVQSRPPKKR